MKTSHRLNIIREVLEHVPGKYVRDQIFSHLFKSPIQKYTEMSNVLKTLRNALVHRLGEEMLSLKIEEIYQACRAAKYLFGLQDNQKIECVWLKYNNGNSLCISSQVGCASKCVFCATGKLGLKRNLTTDEIADQVLFFIKQGIALNNVTLMGMGEPLMNPNIFDALEILTHPKYINIGRKRLTISTVGVVDGIRRITEQFPQIVLTFSLHSPFSEERASIIPMEKTYPTIEVMQALNDHIEKTNNKTYLAYTVIPGKNDTQAHAKGVHELIAKTKKPLRHLYHINLVHYHRIDNLNENEKTNNKSIYLFKKQLEDLKLSVTVRPSLGLEIEAACGQLHAKLNRGPFT